jgi:hypothetical protein
VDGKENRRTDINSTGKIDVKSVLILLNRRKAGETENGKRIQEVKFYRYLKTGVRLVRNI